MKSLESFLRKHTPAKRVSALEAFKEQILRLYENNFKIEQIQLYLSTEAKIEISTRRIYQFIKANKNLTKNFSLKTPSAVITKKKSGNQGVATENSKATNAYFARMQKLAQGEKE